MRKIVCLLIAALMLVSVCACGSNKKEGVLKVGMECAYAPFNWTQTDDSNGAVKIANADGYANGYDVQIAKKLADSMGLKLEVYAYDWDSLIPAVTSGTLDAIIAGMSPTAERKEVIDFTNNYYESNLVIITKSGSAVAGASSLDDLAGTKIGAQAATFHETAVTQIPDVNPTILDDFTMLYRALVDGTIDGYVAEEPTAFAICGANESLTYVKLVNNSNGFSVSPDDVAIAVGVKKGSDLTGKFNEVINGLSDAEKSELMQNMVSIAPQDE